MSSTHPDPHTVAKKLGLDTMKRFDVTAPGTTADLLDELANTAFSARTLGESLAVAESMLRDNTWVVLTLSGAMTMAGLSLLVVEMIERGWIHAIVATGALVGHGLTEDIGLDHFKADPRIPDKELLAHRFNRVYDVIEPEFNLDTLDAQVSSALIDLAADPERSALGTWDLLEFFGKQLPGRGILQAAVAHKVPVFIPAFTDSELGLDFAVFNEVQRSSGEKTLHYDAFIDLHKYSSLCTAQAASGRPLGIFTIGGGVPRNWAQQVGPYIDVSNDRLGRSAAVPRFSYGIRICPDPVHYGHLSGSTYSEGVTWGKFLPKDKGGRFAEILLDATVAWPLLVRALIERGF